MNCCYRSESRQRKLQLCELNSVRDIFLLDRTFSPEPQGNALGHSQDYPRLDDLLEVPTKVNIALIPRCSLLELKMQIKIHREHGA